VIKNTEARKMQETLGQPTQYAPTRCKWWLI